MNVITFELDMSSSVHVDNKGRYLSSWRTNTRIRWYDIKQQKENILLILHNQEKDLIKLTLWWKQVSYLLILQKYISSKQKNSEIKDYALCLGNATRFYNWYCEKTGLKGVLKFFSVDFNPIDNNDILDINKHLMKRTWYKIMFALIKNIFIGLLTGLVDRSNHTKCVLLSNKKCEIPATLINLHPN